MTDRKRKVSRRHPSPNENLLAEAGSVGQRTVWMRPVVLCHRLRANNGPDISVRGLDPLIVVYETAAPHHVLAQKRPLSTDLRGVSTVSGWLSKDVRPDSASCCSSIGASLCRCAVASSTSLVTV